MPADSIDHSNPPNLANPVKQMPGVLSAGKI